MKNHRYHELDSMRAIAALGVICWHYVHTYHAAPFGHVLAPFFGRGLLLVDFFFVLSGFVLCGALWNERRAHDLRSNLRARVARMYPLHLVTLIAVAAMQWVLTHPMGQPAFTYAQNDLYHFGLNLTLLNASGLQHGFSFNAPSWSISTELIVNCVFLAVIACGRSIAIAALSAIGIAALSTMAVRGVINGSPAFGMIDNDLVRTFAGFVVGLGLYRAHQAIRSKSGWWWDIVAMAISGWVFWYLGYAAPSNLNDMLTCYVAFPVLIVSVIRSESIKALLTVRPMVYLGEISYSIYLVHFPLLLAAHLWSTATGFQLPADSRLYFVAFIAAVIATASVTYRYVESPGRRLLAATAPTKAHRNLTQTTD